MRPPLPEVKNAAWVRNPIDAFIAAEHERAGLTPQPRPTSGLLLRRVYLDLIGLPPTRDELRRFLADESPDAYEKVVDRLLASPQYGERWGRHWMDIWRYSDWWGLGAEVRNSQKHIWHWRDWIIESLNADMGYDEMVRQMLAADELYPNDLDKLRATGFLARQYFKFNRTTWLDETVEHTSQGVPRPDVQLRQVPRPQVRSDRAGRLLPVAGHLRAVPGAAPIRCPARPTSRRTASRGPSIAISTRPRICTFAATTATPTRQADRARRCQRSCRSSTDRSSR